MGRTEIVRIGIAGLIIAATMLIPMQWIDAGGGGSIADHCGNIGGYVALNTGANYLANNVGPAVGS